MNKIKKAWRAVESAPWHVKLILVLSIIYLLSPIDLIPDFIPGLGQLDDIVLVVLVTRYVRKHIPEFNINGM